MLSRQGLKLQIASHYDVKSTIFALTDHMSEAQRAVFRDKLQRYARKPDRDLIIAVCDNRVLGLICVIEKAEVPASLPSSTAQLLSSFACNTQLLVHPDARKQGIGSSLQLKAEQWARARGRAGFWLVTRRMAYWYQRDFGYEKVGSISAKNTEKSVMAKEFR